MHKILTPLVTALLLLGLDVSLAQAQPAPVVTAPAMPAPAAPALRSAPLDLDERELEQAIIEGQPRTPSTEWAIAPAPTAAPTPAPTPAPAPAPAIGAQPVPAPYPATVTFVTPPPPGPTPAALASTTTVPHISGGVGYDERAHLEAVKPQYNLRLLFAISGAGSYLSGVKVRIQDPRGNTLLDTVSNGPWFFAQLPPGAYTLTLDNQGQVQQRSVNILPQRPTVENVYWTAAPQDNQVAPSTVGNAQPFPGGSVPEAAGYGAPAPTATPLSPRRTATGIPYLTGGLDPEERARLEASQGQFNLRLNFSLQNAGDRPFRIQVRIQDPTRRTTLMEAEANGPLFMAQLPPGRYLVTLTYSGQEVQREMSVPGYGAASASFEWTH